MPEASSFGSGLAVRRSEALQAFLDAAYLAFDRFAADTRSRSPLARLFALADSPGEVRTLAGTHLPVCERYLDQAHAVGTNDPVLTSLVARFKALEPELEWKERVSYDASASANFSAGHANTMIVGPGALEHRGDLWIGASLTAPHVRDTDHSHAPEETYLVLSEGEFRQADDAWFSPGIGGLFYNPPHIKHAMRSGASPLFAFWALLPARTNH